MKEFECLQSTEFPKMFSYFYNMTFHYISLQLVILRIWTFFCCCCCCCNQCSFFYSHHFFITQARLSKQFFQQITFFINLMNFSHHPPHHAVVGGLNLHSIELITLSFYIRFQFNHFKYLAASIKLEPFSQCIIERLPLRDTHLLKATKKASVDADVTSSKCTA